MRKSIAFAALAAAAGAAGLAAASETVGYRYDVHGRLIRMDRSGSINNGIRTTYGWDRADNRTNRQVRIPTATISVANPSYEEPEVGTGQIYNPSVTGMTFASYSGVSTDNGVAGFRRAVSGDQVGFIQGTSGSAGSISHTVSGLTAGSSYRITFWLAYRQGRTPNTVHVSGNGASLGSYTPTNTEFDRFTTPAFQASGSTATITFAGTASWGDEWAELDAVSVAP